MTRTLAVLTITLAACGDSYPAPNPPPLPPAPPGQLHAPADFASFTDPAQRSRAIFTEASRVMLSPRCMNCHPVGDTPLQGENGEVHDPPVLRGEDDQGIPALRCTTCHQDRNLQLSRVPGAPKWHLAPKVMAWVGKTPRALCEQIKDPARNGKKTLARSSSIPRTTSSSRGAGNPVRPAAGTRHASRVRRVDGRVGQRRSGVPMTIRVRINGADHELDVDPDMPILWALRDVLGLNGTKYGCGQALCGACTVHLEGEAVRACCTPIRRADGKAITTIEGLSADGSHPLQKAWIELGVPQCGFCQSGQIMAAAALLSKKAKPTAKEIDDSLSGNLCRCGTYMRIRAAVQKASGQ